MKVRDPHTLSFRNPGTPPEEVDTLLHNFFRAQMPDPWPVLKAPAEAPFRSEVRAASRWTPLRSRVALAASVALLLLASWGFSAKTPDYSMPPQSNSTNSGEASPAPLYRQQLRLNSPNKVESKSPGCCGCCNK